MRKPGRGDGENLTPKLRKGLRKGQNPYVHEAKLMAERFCERVHERFGTELSYDIDHILRVDRLLKGERDFFDDEVLLMAGFYLGEVLRRTHKGRYQWSGTRDALALEIGAIRIFPIEKLRAIHEGADDKTLESFVLILGKKLLDARKRSDSE